MSPAHAARPARGLDDATVAAIADELAAATSSRGTIERISARYPAATIEDSYAVQRIWRTRREQAGTRMVGRKIGLTSKAMQFATGISEPDYGVIFADQTYRSGATVEHAQWSNVRVEVELAFVLRAPLEGDGLTIEQVLDATEVVVPALEILDSHIELEGRTIVDTISDNAALGAIVVGEHEIGPRDRDLSWVGSLCLVNDEIIETGVSGGVLGNPALGVAWLAGKLAQHGDRLEAGELILAGSFTRPVWVKPGDVVRAEYQDMGTVEVTFR
ncbi:fumarylacetoacetate hydrolase family protein [Agrococcus sp. ARC_14]|uniref:2-keto-4-pentenoate hydratase n=1 Tax=Agrococcus sp. ARC_14 TaxID=2919927 RepID=UPI001F06ACC6|nr:fumarylacetoacetate hydrolase family protein [Agrococcus sp. ARC_14]MCH1882468.1 fumarylacetoacetate hydrolase family protein [Agrococcus sp. ARC_14]